MCGNGSAAQKRCLGGPREQQQQQQAVEGWARWLQAAGQGDRMLED